METNVFTTFDPLAAALLVLRILGFALPFAATLFVLLPPENRWNCLAENNDGRRMVIFSLILVLAGVFAPNGTALVTIISTVAFWLALGMLIACNDDLTKTLLPSWSWIIYLPLGILAYFFGAGYGSFGITTTPNLYGFVQMLLPVGAVALFGNLAVFSGILTDGYKLRIFPQDGAGYRFMLVGATLVLLALFNTNGIAMVALMVFAMNAFAYGLLVAFPEGATKFLLNDWVALPFALLAAGSFYFGIM